MSGKTFWERAILNLDVFDALQFKFVQQRGWNNEINHAFNPLFPMIFPSSLATAFLLQLAVSYVNMLLIFRVGDRVFNNKQIAELSAYLYIFSFSIVYQVSFYSENTFVCFSLLGFYFLGEKTH